METRREKIKRKAKEVMAGECGGYESEGYRDWERIIQDGARCNRLTEQVKPQKVVSLTKKK